jgi:hypothetical protein
VYEYLALRAVESDLDAGLTSTPFPSQSHDALLKRYAARYGVRDVFQHLVYVGRVCTP